MTSFELPAFYMPYPARCSPHLESARVNTKAWAVQMGMLNAPTGASGVHIWDEHEFDTTDVALFAALIYPDAFSAPELDLLAEWHIWLFYFDDHFLKVYKDSRDLASANEHLDRLPLFMPIDTADAIPEPTNPVEAGLADLWPRTVPIMSEKWRSRFFNVTNNVIQEPLRELVNIRADRIPNPIDYVEMRRQTGGALCGAILIEHALCAEVPDEVASTRPMRVLNDTFADGVHLRNDILSYPREVLAGEINGVMVVEQFLDCDLKRAVDLVNELATSRLQQFENTALVELPLMVAEHGLGSKECLDVLKYVKGLQDCMAGDLEWESKTVRYNDTESPSSTDSDQPLADSIGKGAAVDRLGLARRVSSIAWPATAVAASNEDASRVELPEFYMPFQARRNPYLECVRAPVKEWTIEMGMLGPEQFVWDEPEFDSADYALFTGLMFPDAQRSEFEIATRWMVWGTFFDDFFDENFKQRRDLVGAKAFFERLFDFIPNSLDEPVPVPVNLVERGLADLWSRTAPAMTTAWRHRFRQSIESIREGFLWEILNLTENRIPDPVDYVEMRRKAAGVEFLVAVMQYSLILDIPSGIYDARSMFALVEAAGDAECLSNDIISFRKEILEGDIHNGVLVVQRFFDCDLRRAVTVVNDLVTSRLRQFEVTATTEVPALLDECDLDAAGRKNIDRYVQGLQSYIAGYVRYLMENRSRYEEPTSEPEVSSTIDIPLPLVTKKWSSGLSGLGTAAIRIAAGRAAGVPASVSMTSPTRARIPLGPTGLGSSAVRIGPNAGAPSS